MPTVVKFGSTPRRAWLALTMMAGSVLVIGGIFLTLTTITAYATRSVIEARLAAKPLPDQMVTLVNLNGGWNWSHLQLGVGITAVVIDIQIQHWGLDSYLQGQILNIKIDPAPFATFSGQVKSQPWNGNFYWNMQLQGKSGSGYLPTGRIKWQPINLYLQAHNTWQNLDFAVQAAVKELHYQGIPVLHAAPVNLQGAGSVNFNHNVEPALDAALNLTANSNYGPLHFAATILGPNNLAALWHSGQLRLRAVLPSELWEMVERWQPFWTQSLVVSGMVKRQTDIVLLNIKFANGSLSGT